MYSDYAMLMCPHAHIHTGKHACTLKTHARGEGSRITRQTDRQTDRQIETDQDRIRYIHEQE